MLIEGIKIKKYIYFCNNFLYGMLYIFVSVLSWHYFLVKLDYGNVLINVMTFRD